MTDAQFDLTDLRDAVRRNFISGPERDDVMARIDFVKETLVKAARSAARAGR